MSNHKKLQNTFWTAFEEFGNYYRVYEGQLLEAPIKKDGSIDVDATIIKRTIKDTFLESDFINKINKAFNSNFENSEFETIDTTLNERIVDNVGVLKLTKEDLINLDKGEDFLASKGWIKIATKNINSEHIYFNKDILDYEIKKNAKLNHKLFYEIELQAVLSNDYTNDVEFYQSYNENIFNKFGNNLLTDEIYESAAKYIHDNTYNELEFFEVVYNKIKDSSLDIQDLNLNKEEFDRLNDFLEVKKLKRQN